LEGSVRKAGQRVRITAQLIDALTGTHLWADRFDGSLEDVFELQDKVASSVAGVIEPALQAAETARSAGRLPADLTAYDLYLRAFAMVLSSTRQVPEALRLMEQVIARDPRYGPALAWAAVCCFRLVQDGRSEDDPAADRWKGVDFARRALEVAGDDPGILVNAALPLAYFGEDIGAMMALLERALSLNPNLMRRNGARILNQNCRVLTCAAAELMHQKAIREERPHATDQNHDAGHGSPIRQRANLAPNAAGGKRRLGRRRGCGSASCPCSRNPTSRRLADPGPCAPGLAGKAP
jgi:tetratricopeptide (TPR) repeat protein